MKQLSAILIGLFAILLISSCTKSPAENITGEWKITDIKTTSEIPEDQIEVYKEAMEDWKASFKMVYNADGTYEKTISEETTKGTWEISEDGKTLTEKSDDGLEESVGISELTDKKFVSVSVVDDETTNTMTFEKVK